VPSKRGDFVQLTILIKQVRLFRSLLGIRAQRSLHQPHVSVTMLAPRCKHFAEFRKRHCGLDVDVEILDNHLAERREDVFRHIYVDEEEPAAYTCEHAARCDLV
jgi:hypothetical protein